MYSLSIQGPSGWTQVLREGFFCARVGRGVSHGRPVSRPTSTCPLSERCLTLPEPPRASAGASAFCRIASSRPSAKRQPPQEVASGGRSRVPLFLTYRVSGRFDERFGPYFGELSEYSSGAGIRPIVAGPAAAVCGASETAGPCSGATAFAHEMTRESGDFRQIGGNLPMSTGALEALARRSRRSMSTRLREGSATWLQPIENTGFPQSFH